MPEGPEARIIADNIRNGLVGKYIINTNNIKSKSGFEDISFPCKICQV